VTKIFLSVVVFKTNYIINSGKYLH